MRTHLRPCIVLTSPGLTISTMMPSSFNAIANFVAIMFSAALDTPYSTPLGWPALKTKVVDPIELEMNEMSLLDPLRIRGRNALVT